MTPLARPLRLVGQEAIEAELARTLVRGELVNSFALDCEIVRGVLWGMTRTGPGHINRLMNLVLDIALAYSSDAEEEATRKRLRSALNALADAGDVVELDQGRWSPTMVRLVDLGPTSEERLFVGGVPSSVLPDPLRGTLSHRGPLRFVRGSELERALLLPVEPLDAWIGVPSVPLRHWAEALLTTPLSPYLEPPEGADVYVYAPAAKKRRTQGGRWMPSSGVADGRYLARRPRVFGAVEYRLVDVRAGSITASGNILLPGEGRRMMYALDAFAARPVEALMVAEGDGVCVNLWSEVPSAERRFFSLVGTLTAPQDGYYPRSWHFHRRWASEVRRRLDALEINVSSHRFGGE